MYAGFWRRFAAIIIDGIIVGIVGGILGAIVGGVIGGVMGAAGAAIEDIQARAALVGYFLNVLINWLYFTISESSNMQATLGKRILGMKVTDLGGNKISFGKANARFWSKILSGLIFSIGFIMAAFTARKQALHDIIAGTLVVKRES